MAANVTRARVVTYNILSSSLAPPDHFPKCNPDNLLPKNRMTKIKAKLEEEIGKKSIICLQEISQRYAADLHPFFVSRGYYFCTGHYGTFFNGYMGVGIAFPLDKYEMVSCETSTVADTKRWPRPTVTWAQYFSDKVRQAFAFFTPMKSISIERFDDWEVAKFKKNQLVFLRLRDLSSQGVFCVGTYHMPCSFEHPKLMNIHTSLVAEKMTYLGRKDPFILAGDFNFKPDSSMYQLITTASLEVDHPEYPVPRDFDPWIVGNFIPLKSAYKEKEGKEPGFTNFAISNWSPDPFVGTLDYIFCTPQFKIAGVLPLRSEPASLDDPYPNDIEPSDHVMIAADVEFF